MIIPSLHWVQCIETDLLPYVVINIGQDMVHLPHATCVGMLIAQEIDISEITTITADISEDKGYETNEELPEPGISSLFITSPTDIEVHRKTNLMQRWKKSIKSSWRNSVWNLKTSSSTVPKI